MSEITRRNCYKSDLETIINNDSQYFWINLRDFEAETESKWLNIFNEHVNASYIKFQPDRIFIRKDLFERIIIKIQDDIEETEKEATKKLIKELSKELSKESDKESDEQADEELIEIISPKNDESTTDWYDKNKFNKILTTIDSNKFNHKNKIGKLKFNDINNLVNNIKNNTISEAHAKQKKLNVLNEIKKGRYKKKNALLMAKKITKFI